MTNFAGTERRASLWLWAACAIVALAYIAVVRETPHANWSPDSDLKQAQIASLRWDGGLRWDLPYPGRMADPSLAHIPTGPTFYEVRDGRIFLVWPLLFPLLSWPFLKIFGAGGLLVVPLAAGVAIAYVTGLTAEVFRRGSGAWAALIAGLATPLFVYSTLLWEHTLAALGGALAVWAMVTQRVRPSLVRLAVGGSALGFAAGAIRADLYTLAAALLIAVTLVERGRTRVRVLAAFGTGLLVASLLSWTFNLSISGHPLPLNAAKNFSTLMTTYLQTPEARPLGDFAVGSQSPAMYVELFVVAAAGVLAVNRDRRLRAFLFALAALAAAALLIARTRAMNPADIQPFHGFVATAPFVVLGLLRVGHGDSDRDRAAKTLSVVGVLYLLLYVVTISVTSPWGPNGGGVEWGPRFFLSAYPLLTVLAVCNVPQIADRLRAPERTLFLGLAAILVLTGVWMDRIGLRVVRRELDNKLAFGQELRASAPIPLVVDVWWMAPTMLAGFETRSTLLFDLADSNGFDAWLEEQARHGVREIEFVSFIRPEEHPFFVACRERRLSCAVEEEHRGAMTAWFSRVSMEPWRGVVPPT